MVREVDLTWHRVHCTSCDAEHAPTPNQQHARDLAAGHSCRNEDGAAIATVQPVTLKLHLASCECGWEGNPAERKRDANAQLTAHRDAEHVEG